MSSTTVASVSLLAQHHSLLYAAWLSATKLFVYRSPVVKDTDDIYLPVKSVLDSFKHRVDQTLTVIDPEMMFGEAQQTVYRIGELDE